MKGNEKVIDGLNLNITAERVAIHAYILKSKILENWGYKELAGKYMQRAHEEMRHLDALLERVLFLEGMPVMTANINEAEEFQWDINAMLKHDHELETGAVKAYNELAEAARAAADGGTRLLAEKHLLEEEAHANWLEDQMKILGDTGKQQYLSEAV